MQTDSCSLFHGTKSKRVFFGLLLVVAGLLFLSFNFGWIDPALKPVLFSWPMIFVVMGIIGFSKRSYLVSFFWLILGFFFLIPRIVETYPGCIRGVDSDFAYTYWPLLLILFGIGFILNVALMKNCRRRGGFSRVTGTTEAVDGRIDKRIVFGGSESIFLDPVFYGGEISVVFGGVILDMRKTQLPEGETHLTIDVVFGGVELYIPGDWQVEAKIQTVCGGIDDKRSLSPSDNSRKLIIHGDLIFGGCELR
jgi:predicted membrane protein